jgi:hypothetical protein
MHWLYRIVAAAVTKQLGNPLFHNLFVDGLFFSVHNVYFTLAMARALALNTSLAPTGNANLGLFFAVNTGAVFDFAAVPRKLFLGFVAIASFIQLIIHCEFGGPHADTTSTEYSTHGACHGAGLQDFLV